MFEQKLLAWERFDVKVFPGFLIRRYFSERYSMETERGTERLNDSVLIKRRARLIWRGGGNIPRESCDLEILYIQHIGKAFQGKCDAFDFVGGQDM